MTDFSCGFNLTLNGGSIAAGHQTFVVQRAIEQQSGYLQYELKLDDRCIGRATCQSSNLILENLAVFGANTPLVEPMLLRLYEGRCHWIETLQILPAYRGRGYGSLWLEALCAMLQSETHLPIALQADEWWDDSTPLTGKALDDWYDRHGFLAFSAADAMFNLRVRDDRDRVTTEARIQQFRQEIAEELGTLFNSIEH